MMRCNFSNVVGWSVVCVGSLLFTIIWFGIVLLLLCILLDHHKIWIVMIFIRNLLIFLVFSPSIALSFKAHRFNWICEVRWHYCLTRKKKPTAAATATKYEVEKNLTEQSDKPFDITCKKQQSQLGEMKPSQHVYKCKGKGFFLHHHRPLLLRLINCLSISTSLSLCRCELQRSEKTNKCTSCSCLTCTSAKKLVLFFFLLCARFKLWAT